MPDLLVYSDWHGARGPRLLGTLSAKAVRGIPARQIETYRTAFAP